MKSNINYRLLVLLSILSISGCTSSKEVQTKLSSIQEESNTIKPASKIAIIDAPSTTRFEIDPDDLIYRSKNTQDSVYYKNGLSNQIEEKVFFPKEETRLVSNFVFPENARILQLIRIGEKKFIVCMQDRFTGAEVPSGVAENSDFIMALLETDSLKPLLRRYDLQGASANVDFRYDISGNYIVMAPYEKNLLIYDIPSERVVKTISVSDSHIRNPSVYQNIVTYTVAKDTDVQSETTSVYSFDILKDQDPLLIDVNSSFSFVYNKMIFYSQLAESSNMSGRKYSIVMREANGEKKVLDTGLINPIWDADFQEQFVNFPSSSSSSHNSVFDYSGNPLGSLTGFSIGSNIELMYDRTDNLKRTDRMLRFIPKRVVIGQ